MTNNINPGPENAEEHFVRGLPFKAHKITDFTPELFERYYEDGYEPSRQLRVTSRKSQQDY